ncbi:hybrid sensor histidine kinase/response regulator [Hydrogenophaga sp.]|uniref:sensor histidine kinase n=1 Tax=Hydrogenophaga sp. TaxID=1904254 RepID=UPI0025C42094|nr:hybrid sensor histidine kinase/response regulator [Hydrogenophaga sp.]MBT9464753.1 hybrid sensor histidine kinase/response regulator [Hydrogenophaga sp.]
MTRPATGLETTAAPPLLPDILIVDDDPGMVQALARVIRPLGRLRFATQGLDALRLMAESPPDLVLLDAQMPGMSGFEVLEAIKGDPLLADIPVIFVTSHAEATFEQTGLEKGAADFIAKPIRPAIVQARVRTQLRLKQANDALKQVAATDRLNLAEALLELRESHAQLQKTAEELQLANEGLLQFVRISSHDLREPLNTVVQFVGLVEEDHAADLPPDTRHYLKLVRHAGERMRTMLDDVVRYARLQHGETEPRTPVALAPLMAEVCDALAAQLGATGAQLHMGDLPVVAGHASLLSQLFQNLVTNALKFMPPGRAPRIEITAETHAGMTLITVKDNGIGISPEGMDKLFQPFSRLNLRREFEGSGLGLAISRQIAEAHGGTITVRSKPGEGSAFEVRLPLA